MYDLSQWRNNPSKLEKLNEADRLVIETELAAERRRTQERMLYDLKVIGNEEKINLIQRWYPHAYEVLKIYYPAFIECPDSFPDNVIKAINRLLYWEFELVDSQLRFK